MGFMFSFKFRGSGYWVDATEETDTAGRLINHSRCHANVSKVYSIELVSLKFHEGYAVSFHMYSSP